jgi:hypothetical protein
MSPPSAKVASRFLKRLVTLDRVQVVQSTEFWCAMGLGKAPAPPLGVKPFLASSSTVFPLWRSSYWGCTGGQFPLLGPVGVKGAGISGVWCRCVTEGCEGIICVRFDALGSGCIRVIRLRKKKAGPARVLDQEPLLVRRGAGCLLLVPSGSLPGLVVGKLCSATKVAGL